MRLLSIGPTGRRDRSVIRPSGCSISWFQQATYSASSIKRALPITLPACGQAISKCLAGLAPHAGLNSRARTGHECAQITGKLTGYARIPSDKQNERPASGISHSEMHTVIGELQRAKPKHRRKSKERNAGIKQPKGA